MARHLLYALKSTPFCVDVFGVLPENKKRVHIEIQRHHLSVDDVSVHVPIGVIEILCVSNQCYRLHTTHTKWGKNWWGYFWKVIAKFACFFTVRQARVAVTEQDAAHGDEADTVDAADCVTWLTRAHDDGHVLVEREAGEHLLTNTCRNQPYIVKNQSS